MAKWGEGDPRWIVEERADAKNVNNWHWTEKNASPWSKEKLRELFKDLKYENSQVDFQVTEISKLTGEATANNRKAKLIFFYEWELELKWTGSLPTSDEDVEGKIEIPNLSEEHLPDDVDVLVTVKSESGDGYKVKNLVREYVTPVIRNKLGCYMKELREEFSQGMILPTKDGCTIAPINTESTKKELKKMALTDLRPGEGEKKNKDVGVKISTKKYTSVEEFMASAEDLYNTLTQKDRVSAFCRSDVQMDASKGGQFSLFGGNVTGKFIDMVPNEKLVMEWRFKDWPDAHHSLVNMDFKQKDNTTEIKLTQTGVPSSDYDRTKLGWKQYYWESIRRTFCYGLKYF